MEDTKKSTLHRAASDPTYKPKLYSISKNTPKNLAGQTGIKWLQVARLVFYMAAPLLAWKISEELRTAWFAPQMKEYFRWLIPIEEKMEEFVVSPEKQQVLFDRTRERLAAADDGTFMTGDTEAAQRKIFWSDIMLKK